jgi:hypothetical protein
VNALGEIRSFFPPSLGLESVNKKITPKVGYRTYLEGGGNIYSSSYSSWTPHSGWTFPADAPLAFLFDSRPVCLTGSFSIGITMKKLRNIDLSGYEAEELDKLLDESTNKTAKRPPKTKRAWEADVPASLKASRLSSNKWSDPRQRGM